MKRVEEIAVVLGKFGDEQSALFDQFERLSFEVQLRNAMLGRSLSEPGVARSLAEPPQAPVVAEVGRGRRGSVFKRVLKKLLRPVIGRKGGGRKEGPDPKDLMTRKAFSRSLRV